MNGLVSTEWLNEHLGDKNLLVLDCTVKTVDEAEGGFHNESGRDEFIEEHIPGAGFADLKNDLCESKPEFGVPKPEAFCDAMGKLGVGDDTSVVLYDRAQGFWAARVWWMLRWVGFDRAVLLDGGFRTWKSEGRPVSSETVERPGQTLRCRLRPTLVADQDEVREAIRDDGVQLLDTLPDASYRGEMPLYGRPGHIPSAINVCAMAHLDDAGRYRPESELETMHSHDKGTRVITYCGGGIMASASAFVLTQLGYEDVAVYTASLQEWASNPENPMTIEQR